jgi:hypothetical protein
MDTPPWEIEEAYFVQERGVDPGIAHSIVVHRWIWHGNYKPLAAAIRAGKKLNDAVLDLLAQQIEEGKLTLRRQKGGRPRDLPAQIRNIRAALTYEAAPGNATVAHLADVLNTSEETIRKAVTASRRSRNKRT